LTQINAENAEFAEKVSCADCYLEKRRVEKDYLRNAIEEVVEYWHKRKYLHSVFSALSVNSAVNLTMSSYIPRVKVKRDFYFLMAKLEREFALRHLDKWEREAEEMKCERGKFWEALTFAVIFAMLAF